jgi:uncharacterized protein YlxP (DUF503 family)
MFVGLGRFEIHIPASTSLKDKRRVLRPVTAAVRKKFNASVAEVDYQDLRQRSTIGVSCVAESNAHCMRMLREIERTVASVSAGEAELIDSTMKVLAMEDL